MRLPTLILATILATLMPTAWAAESLLQPGDWQMGLRVPMRDGIVLVGDLLLPSAPGRYPTIFEFTPYGRGADKLNFRNEAEFWVQHGYAFMVVDTRGQSDSGGHFGFFIDTQADGYDLVGWIARQSWSNARVGMRGASYTGVDQWYVARSRPPALKCIAPNSTLARPMEEVPYQGGVFVFGWAINWIAHLSDAGVKTDKPIDYQALLGRRPLNRLDEVVYGKPLALYRKFLEHPTLDSYWQTMQFDKADFTRLTLPTFGSTGWFDGTQPGTVFFYEGMKQHSSVPQDQFLVIGPWEHANTSDGGYDYLTNQPRRKLGDLEFPDNAFFEGKELARQFFDWCLKDGPRFKQPSARVYITGSNRWLDFDTYPPRSTVTSLYLASGGHANGMEGDGRLVWKASSARKVDRYVYDPMHPVSSMPPGTNQPLGLMGNPIDLKPLLDRPDVLAFLSDPLDKPLTILGNVRMTLYASSDARDTDFMSQIEDVGPDGKAVKLGSTNGAMIRARYRLGYDREVLLTPNEPTKFDLDYFDIGHTFLKGHRIRVTVTSSAYPWAFPNPNTGNPIATDTAEPRKAQQTVFHDASRPSQLLLPVIATP